MLLLTILNMNIHKDENFNKLEMKKYFYLI